jgi:hypothetical protein
MVAEDGVEDRFDVEYCYESYCYESYCYESYCYYPRSRAPMARQSPPFGPSCRGAFRHAR